MPSPASPEEYAAFLEWRATQVQDDQKYNMGRAVQAKAESATGEPLTPTSAKQWKKDSAETDLVLPSGNVCRVKRPGLPALLSKGVLPDTLTPLIKEAMAASDSGPSNNVSRDKVGELMDRPDGLASLVDACCRIVGECVVEPTALYHKRLDEGSDTWHDIPDEERDPDILYTDEVDLDDSMFIFQFVVGGSRDLTEFRKTTS